MNRNGKNGPVNTFLFTQEVAPTFSEKEEYLGGGLSLLRDHIS